MIYFCQEPRALLGKAAWYSLGPGGHVTECARPGEGPLTIRIAAHNKAPLRGARPSGKLQRLRMEMARLVCETRDVRSGADLMARNSEAGLGDSDEVLAQRDAQWKKGWHGVTRAWPADDGAWDSYRVAAIANVDVAGEEGSAVRYVPPPRLPVDPKSPASVMLRARGECRRKVAGAQRVADEARIELHVATSALGDDSDSEVVSERRQALRAAQEVLQRTLEDLRVWEETETDG